MENPVDSIKSRMIDIKKEIISYEILFKRNNHSVRLIKELSFLYITLNNMYEIYKLEMLLIKKPIAQKVKEFKLTK